MKRLISILTASIILFGAVFGAIPVIGQDNIKIGDFSADKYAVTGTENQSVKFTVDINSTRNLSAKKVRLVDESGNLVSYMNDDGVKGDERANDGIYTAECNLYSEKVCTVNYYAQVGTEKSSKFSVKFNGKITDADFETAHRIWDKLESIENALADMGRTSEEIADAAYDWLIKNESENLACIKRENERAFSFTLSTGIENYFEHFRKDGICENAEQIAETVRGLSFIGQGSIGVWSPYYGTDSSFSYNYLNRARAMQEVAGYDTVESYYGAEASVDSFKNFDRYGVVMIDSHGADYNGGGYICIPHPGSYDSQDVAEGHIVLSGGTVYLRGTFMQKYCETLPNSIVYIGICYGMAADNLYRPLLAHGAAFCCGYTDSVSFSYDGIMMDEFCMQLVKTNETTGLQNTAGEAFDKAIEIHGVVDPYGDARFIYKGDRDVVACGIKTPIESVCFDPDEITIYRNNEITLSPVISPAEANRYTIEWETSDPDIVSVTAKGAIKALADGTATIKIIVTDTAEDEEKIFNAECRIIVDGDMPVSGLSLTESYITMYEGISYVIHPEVLPHNATNQKVFYSSSDDEIVTVDENGKITPVSIGKAYVYATTEDGGYTAKATVIVNEKTLQAALNKTNGILSFTTDGSVPNVETEGERLYAHTTNRSNSSKSHLYLNTHMKKGDKLVFDWRVSSEYGYDTFEFYANGVKQDDISGEKQWDTITYTANFEYDFKFEWRYTKDYSTSDGSDCGMLDEVDIIRNNETHTVTFYDMDRETVIEAQEVAHGESAVLPAAPKHEGYAFVAWDGDWTNVRADVSVYAEYEEHEDVYYKVTFLDMDGETVLSETDVLENTAAVAPEPPVHEGYTFAGWDKDFSCVKADMTVIALYDINVYNVTFLDMDGETILSEQKVEHGSAAEAPEAPEHEGFTFVGWDKDFSCVTEDMIITAVYDENKVTVTFLDMDGETVIAEVEVIPGQGAEAPEAPEHSGYVFTGWDKDFSEVDEDTTVTALYSLLGDSNGDGKVNTADAVLILKYAAGMVDLDDILTIICDVNRSGKVNTADATLILKYAAGMITEF